MKGNLSLIAAAFVLAWTATARADLVPVECEGRYKHHLQGVCAGDDSIFWCFTTALVKTDQAGKILKQVDVASHHGDLCFHESKIYVAVNLGKFNDPQGNADSQVYVYDASDLSLLTQHKTAEVFHGAGGIACHDGRFVVVGGLPPGAKENVVYEYDQNFQLATKHVLKSGYTLMGIQTAAFADGHWWFGCYGKPAALLKADLTFQRVERFEFDCAVGIVPLGGGAFLVGRDASSKENLHTGRLAPAEIDEARGLRLVQPRTK